MTAPLNLADGARGNDPLKVAGIPRSIHRTRAGKRRGIAAVEFALVLPFLVILLLGTWEVGRLVEVQQVLDSAASEGGRQASAGVMTNDEVRDVVLKYLAHAGLNSGNAAVTIRDVSTPGADVSEAAYLDEIHVTVTLPYRDVRWSTTSLIVNSATEMSSQVVWFSARAQPYPTDISAPVGY